MGTEGERPAPPKKSRLTRTRKGSLDWPVQQTGTFLERLKSELEAVTQFGANQKNQAKVVKESYARMSVFIREIDLEHQGLNDRVQAAELRLVHLEEELARAMTAIATLKEGNVEQVVQPTTTIGVQTDSLPKSGPKPKKNPKKTGDGTSSGTLEKPKKGSTNGDGKSTPAADQNSDIVPGKPGGGWQEVKNRKRRSRGAKRRHKGEALIVKAERANYADILKSMRTNPDLGELGTNVRSIKRSSAGELILVLNREATGKCQSYKALAEGKLGEGVTVRAVTSEATLQVKQLDEITTEAEVASAVSEQCAVNLSVEAVKLRKGPRGTQIARFKLPVEDANKALIVGKVKVGWSVCPISAYTPPQVCFRCLEPGHKAYNCKGEDRSKRCRRCGDPDHQIRRCKNPQRCMACKPGEQGGHMTGSALCPALRSTSSNPVQQRK